MGGDSSSIDESNVLFGKRKQGFSFIEDSLERNKKRAFEKSSKAGHKKDLEKIKLMGETLVEPGFVRTLESHFSNP